MAMRQAQHYDKGGRHGTDGVVLDATVPTSTRTSARGGGRILAPQPHPLVTEYLVIPGRLGQEPLQPLDLAVLGPVIGAAPASRSRVLWRPDEAAGLASSHGGRWGWVKLENGVSNRWAQSSNGPSTGGQGGGY
jgi:hypothetical protein